MGLPNYATEEDLKEALVEFGDVVSVKWLEKNGRFRGSAYVELADTESTTKVVDRAEEGGNYNRLIYEALIDVGVWICNRQVSVKYSNTDIAHAASTFSNEKKGSGRGKSEWTPSPKPDGCVSVFLGTL